MMTDTDDTPATVDRARVVAGRYEILERVGAGAMGQVLHVRHLRLGKRFALKLMRPELALDPEACAVFVAEARLASTLSHPNIVSVVDFGEDPDWGSFIAMELLDGDPLSSRIAAGRLPVEIVCHVVRQLALALQHSHDRKVVHGDVKSENVLCVARPGDEEDDWHVKLLDFGTARVAMGAGELEDVITGTPEYVAPERIHGTPPAPANDLYSLGVVMYEMLAGQTPFAGASVADVLDAQLNHTPESVAARRGEVLDDELTSIVDRCLAKAPEDRYQTAGALAQDLADYMLAFGIRERALAQRTGYAASTREEAAADAFEAIPIPCAGLEIDGTIRLMNQAFATLVGAGEPSELEGASVFSTSLGVVHPGIREDIRLAAMLGKTIHGRLRVPATTDGAEDTELRLTLSPASGRSGPCTLVVHPLGAAPPQSLRLIPVSAD